MKRTSLAKSEADKIGEQLAKYQTSAFILPGIKAVLNSSISAQIERERLKSINDKIQGK